MTIMILVNESNSLSMAEESADKITQYDNAYIVVWGVFSVKVVMFKCYFYFDIVGANNMSYLPSDWDI